MLVVLLMKQAESRCHLIRLTAPPKMVTSVLVRLPRWVDWWVVPKDVLLTLELSMQLSKALMKLQEGEKLSSLTQSLLNLPLYQ